MGSEMCIRDRCTLARAHLEYRAQCALGAEQAGARSGRLTLHCHCEPEHGLDTGISPVPGQPCPSSFLVAPDSRGAEPACIAHVGFFASEFPISVVCKCLFLRKGPSKFPQIARYKPLRIICILCIKIHSCTRLEDPEVQALIVVPSQIPLSSLF